jgi:hypothetical protein
MSKIKVVDISDNIWNEFIDSGEVPDVIIVHIVNQIIKSKELTDRQMSIYNSHSNLIENVIKKVKEYGTDS